VTIFDIRADIKSSLPKFKINADPDRVKQVFNEIISVPNQEFLVIEVDGVVRGSLYLQIIPNLTHNAHPWAILENMIIDGNYQRQGLDGCLINYALKRCREVGSYKVQLLSNKKRKEAHLFYHSMGFDDSALSFRLYLQLKIYFSLFRRHICPFCPPSR
jgi:GNAT superfamily N-acetyltransferase